MLNIKRDTVLSKQSMRQLIEEILESNRRIEHKLDSLITNQNLQSTSQENDEEINILSSLPLGVDYFENFDRLIAQSSGFKNRVIKLFMTIGGKDAKSLVFNLMRNLISDEVGERYSLTGKTSGVCVAKMPFDKTEAYRLILEICIHNFQDVKMNVLREAISDWLMQSKFRKSKREKRSESRFKET